MAKFFISFERAGQLSEDDEGQDLPDLETAKTAAIMSCRELLANDIRFASKTPLEAVIITNEKREELARLLARDILPKQATA